MKVLRQYVCWTRESVMAVSPRDAASLGPGHFQAVHHPLRLRQRRIEERQGGHWVEQEAVLDALSGSLRPDGYLFVPIVGGSGTGKSHLVRWVHEQVRDRAGWEVRYLAKNRTSIRRVIEIVCEGLDGAAIRAVREALATAPAHAETEEVLAERLLDELALITSDPPGNLQLDARQLELQEKLRRELPDVLRDPVVRRRLTAEASVVPRLVGLALRGREHGDGLDDDAIYVTEDDIPVSFEEIGSASAGARGTLLQMASNATIRLGAVQLINRCLPGAVKRVFVSDRVNLIEVFRDVRRELLRRDKELVLFIEDLTVMHGVEREFLDAIVEPAIAPDGKMCRLRILFAVTAGHFDDLDTVRTRCEDAYWLDAPYGEDGVGEEEAVSFVARYLNAGRLDARLFEDGWDRAGEKSFPPNACAECELQDQCHEAFGTSEEGYGLYPLNREAIGKLTLALSSIRFDPRESTRFDPREVVRRLVNHFLLRSEIELPRRDFPSDALVAPFERESEPLDAILAARLRSRHPGDHEQLANVLRYWTPGGEETVPDVVLDAFGLPLLQRSSASEEPGSEEPGSAADPVARRRPSARRRGVSDPAGSGGAPNLLKGSASSFFAELTAWHGNQRTLTARATNHFRKLIHKTVLENLEWSAAVINDGPEFKEHLFHPEKHVYIEGSVTVQRRDGAMIIVDQSPETAGGLQGLLLLNENFDTEYPNEARYRHLAAKLIDEWTASVMTTLESGDVEGQRAEVEGLLVCGLVGGAFQKARDATDYLAELFTEVPAPDSERSSAWHDLVDEAATQQRRLQPKVEAYFGEARGTTGAVRGVRADVLLGVIARITEAWPMRSSDAAIERLMRKARGIVVEEWEALVAEGAVVAQSLDRGRSWEDQAGRVLGLVERTHVLGRLRDTQVLNELRRIKESTKSISVGELSRFVDIFKSQAAVPDQLRCLASPLARDLMLVARFVGRVDEVLQQIDDDLSHLDTGEDSESELQRVTEAILETISRLTGSLEEVS